MSKILTVFGATGNQGGSVIKSILAHPTLSQFYKIRAVTRDATKPSAQKLAKQGNEVVTADLDDANSIRKAVQSAHAVFLVTDFWTHMSKDIEVKQGKAIADASKAAGVKHFIFSTLPHVTNLTNGVLKNVVHFDGKAEVADYVESIKGKEMATSYFMPAYYLSNLLSVVQSADKETGEYTIMVPWGQGDQAPLPVIDITTDTGTYVAAILHSDVDKVNGQYFQGVSQWLTANQLAKSLSEATGKTFTYRDAPPDVWAAFLPPAVATEFKENMILMRDYSYYGKGSEKDQAKQDQLLNITKKSSIAQWVKEGHHWQ